MRHLSHTGMLAVAVIAGAVPAKACMTFVPLRAEDVRYADTVVVGRVEKYRIIRHDPSGRKADRVVKSPGPIWDYARFEVVVDQVLLGRAPRRLSVTWDNSTFDEPESMAPGPYLIALRNPARPIPPLRGPSATIFPAPRADLPTLLQAPCSSPFLLPAAGGDADAVRGILAGKPEPERR
ncbi:hypothetical protein OMP43_01110 [Sphingomonas sp. CBMAI 2297]|uniref:hypothetical protein n=1 Tax=Sphingomonas sp. CBMAI 2297 TaxID=2991720 RepID=UPI0024585E19|nr:hypothetical protein [Sphingomonas sp. CBMAI 2297]MDH4742609.1 hypothetical protein [Sphingomonas sp. CBMAI 2297]